MSPASYRTAPPRVECVDTLVGRGVTGKSAPGSGDPADRLPGLIRADIHPRGCTSGRRATPPVQLVDEVSHRCEPGRQAGPAQPDPEVIGPDLEHAPRYQQDAVLP